VSVSRDHERMGGELALDLSPLFVRVIFEGRR
jgi:hypothetical protein